MTAAEFLAQLRDYGFHIGDGLGDNCSGTDGAAEETAAAEIYRALTGGERPCCASCAHWGGRPYAYNICNKDMLACDEGGGYQFRPHAHFLCVLYEPGREPAPAVPELFKMAATDGKIEQYSRELAESFAKGRKRLRGK